MSICNQWLRPNRPGRAAGQLGSAGRYADRRRRSGRTDGRLSADTRALRDCLVVEDNETYVGGISRTERHGGYSFDIGGHRFFSKSQDVEALWREMLPGGFIERPRSSRIIYRDKLYSYPLRAFEALAKLGIVESILCVLSYVKARLFPKRNPVSFHDWVANEFGERLFGIFFKTYTEKVWGMNCDSISADWAAQRIRGLNLFVAIVSARASRAPALEGRRQDADRVLPLSAARARHDLGGGRGTIVERGGRIVMGQAASGFAWDEESGLWIVTAVDSQGRKHRYRARRIISSAPMREVAAAVMPRPASVEAAGNLRYRDFLTVALLPAAGRPSTTTGSTCTIRT